ncbi:MFS transporter [bacterium]|nr:MAG: MFS transporter [bacterium]
MAENICRNARLFKWFWIFREPLFWGPILIHYIQHTGKMSLSSIYLMESFVALYAMCLEIVTGSLADQLGRKKTIIAGSIFCLASIIGLVIANCPIHMWIMNFSCMTGLALYSGATEAFLYDTLAENNQKELYEKIYGQAIGIKFLIHAFCSLIAGWFYEIHPRFPIILSIPGSLIALVMVMYFEEPKYHKKQYDMKEQLQIMKKSMVFVMHHKKVQWIISFGALIVVVSKLWFFTYNPYFELVKLPFKLYGIIFFCLNIIAWIFATHAHAIDNKLGEQTCIISIILIMGFAITLMGTFVTLAFVWIVLLQNITRGFMNPFMSRFMNQHLKPESRATVLSIKSAISGLIAVIALAIFGGMIKVLTLSNCLQILGITMFILGGICIWKFKKVFDEV